MATEVPASGPALRSLRACGRALLRLPRPVACLLPLAWAGWSSSRSPAPDLARHQALSVTWNLAHAPAFGLLCLFLLPLAPRAGGWIRLGVAQRWCLGGLAALYGAVDEWHQSFVPGREPSVFDVVTDAVGVGCVLWITVYLGQADASEGGLRRRLAAGLGLCLAAALSSTFLG